MSKLLWPLRIVLAYVFLTTLSGPLHAQSPIGGEFRLYAGPLAHFDPRIVFYPDGRFLATFSTVDDDGSAVWVERFSNLGKPLGPEILVRQGHGFDNHGTIVGLAQPAVSSGGEFWVVWSEDRPDICFVDGSDLGGGTFARRFSSEGIPVSESFRLGTDCFLAKEVALSGLHLVTLANSLSANLSLPYFAFISEFDSTGVLLRQFRLSSEPEQNQQPLALQTTDSGDLLVGWASCVLVESYCHIFQQRFSQEGIPLSLALLFNRQYTPKDSGLSASVSFDATENAIAVWEAEERNGPDGDIYMQRVSAAGERIGRTFVVNSTRLSAQRDPSVATDRFGNFVVVWQSYDPALGQFYGWHVRGQLFRRDGTRVGKEFIIPNPGGDNDHWQPTVVFGPNGTFLLHYVATGPVLIRRYAASPADEPCVWNSAGVSCDTGRTGGDAELPLALRLYPGDVPLFGDVDGDDRADPCIHRGRRFLCDTDHEGGTFEWQVQFGTGTSKEIPLLGDVDGDGRAEACLWSGKQFQCDTGHNGGKAEWMVTFGQPGDQPLLGDVDGDGRDDPCVYRAGQFLCDTAHNGAAAEWTVTFGIGGDQPVLGDFDGDGRDDPCVFRAGEFLCDTAHDGGTVEARLVFGRAGDWPLLGNLDGL